MNELSEVNSSLLDEMYGTITHGKKKIMLIFIIKIIKARCCIVKVTNLFKIDFTFVIDQITFYCCANYFGIF